MNSRIGRSRGREAAFGAELGKAIPEMFTKQKKAFVIVREDRKGMSAARETFRETG